MYNVSLKSFNCIIYSANVCLQFFSLLEKKYIIGNLLIFAVWKYFETPQVCSYSIFYFVFLIFVHSLKKKANVLFLLKLRKRLYFLYIKRGAHSWNACIFDNIIVLIDGGKRQMSKRESRDCPYSRGHLCACVSDVTVHVIVTESADRLCYCARAEFLHIPPLASVICLCLISTNNKDEIKQR